MRLYLSQLVGCLAAVLWAMPATAEIVTSCAAPQGYAYFFGGGLVPPDWSGWQSDSVNDGTMLLSWKDKKFQIQYKYSQNWKDMESEGGQIIVISNQTKNIIYLLFCMNLVSWCIFFVTTHPPARSVS